jgi:hypothetical protein
MNYWDIKQFGIYAYRKGGTRAASGLYVPVRCINVGEGRLGRTGRPGRWVLVERRAVAEDGRTKPRKGTKSFYVSPIDLPGEWGEYWKTAGNKKPKRKRIIRKDPLAHWQGVVENARTKVEEKDAEMVKAIKGRQTWMKKLKEAERRVRTLEAEAASKTNKTGRKIRLED